MPYLFVRYAVKDYQRWREVFDPDTVDQRAAGAHVRYALQDADDPNQINLLAYVTNRESVEKFGTRPELKCLIEKAGVLLPTVRYHWLVEEP